MGTVCLAAFSIRLCLAWCLFMFTHLWSAGASNPSANVAGASLTPPCGLQKEHEADPTAGLRLQGDRRLWSQHATSPLPERSKLFDNESCRGPENIIRKDGACVQDILTCMRTSVWPWARPCSRHVSCSHALSHTSLPAVRTSKTRLGSNSYARGRRRLNTACMKPATSLQP